jgi:hypothetical protein
MFCRPKKLWDLDGDLWRHLPFWKQTGLTQLIYCTQKNEFVAMKKTGELGAEQADVLQSGNGASAH